MISFLLFALIGVVFGVVVSEVRRRFGHETKGLPANLVASPVALVVIVYLSVGVIGFLFAFLIYFAFFFAGCYVHDCVFKSVNKS